MDELYTLEITREHNWSSVTGDLLTERLAHLNHLIGGKVLEAGCGGGAYVDFLSRKGFTVTGIDKYGHFLQLAKKKGYLGQYVQSDITDLPFRDRAFDCAYSFDVLEHVDDKKAIQELARVTTGRLIFAVPQKDEVMNKFNLTFYPYQDRSHLRYYTEDSIEELLSNIRYSKLTIVKEGFVPFRTLFEEMMEFNKKKHSIPIFKLKPPPGSFRERLVWKCSNILLNRVLDYESLTRWLLNNSSPKQVNTGLAAIIDM